MNELYVHAEVELTSVFVGILYDFAISLYISYIKELTWEQLNVWRVESILIQI